MPQLTDYELQVLKLKRWNRLVMLMTAGLVLILMFIIVGYGYFMQHQTKTQLAAVQAELIRQQEEHKKTTDENLRLNKAQVCILNVPAIERTTADIEGCMKKFNAYVDLANE
jgi:predicted negative regulator of RcsB-dependent stress response